MAYEDDDVMKVFFIGLFSCFAVGMLAVAAAQFAPPECRWRRAQVLTCETDLKCSPEMATICVRGEK